MSRRGIWAGKAAQRGGSSEAFDEHWAQFLQGAVEAVPLPVGDVVLEHPEPHHRGGVRDHSVDAPVGAGSDPL